MRKTYAYSGIIIGLLLGLYIGLKTRNLVIGILACIGLSVAAFVVIRLLENLFYKGADKVADKAEEAWQRHKAEKELQNGAAPQPAPERPLTQFPTQAAPAEPAEPAAPVHFCPNCGAPAAEGDVFCNACGGKLTE